MFKRILEFMTLRWLWDRRRAKMSMAIGFSPLAATNFPTGGHLFSPLVATNLPTNRNAAFRCLGEWDHPLAGGRLRESVAVLTVGDLVLLCVLVGMACPFGHPYTVPLTLPQHSCCWSTSSQ